MDWYDALDRATVGFAAVLDSVRPDQWALPSIDPDWSVRDLVNHVVGGNRRYVLLLSGAPTVEVEALRDLDHLGTDPAQAFRSTAAEVAAAFRRPDALAVTVHHRLGDRSGADLLVMRVIEHAVHGWDLATSIGVDSRIDAAVIDKLLAAFDAEPRLLAESSFPPVDRTLSAGIDPQKRVLVLTGRGH